MPGKIFLRVGSAPYCREIAVVGLVELAMPTDVDYASIVIGRRPIADGSMTIAGVYADRYRMMCFSPVQKCVNNAWMMNVSGRWRI